MQNSTIESDIIHISTTLGVLLEHSINCLEVSTNKKYGRLMFADLDSAVETLLTHRSKVRGRWKGVQALDSALRRLKEVDVQFKWGRSGQDVDVRRGRPPRSLLSIRFAQLPVAVSVTIGSGTGRACMKSRHTRCKAVRLFGQKEKKYRMVAFGQYVSF